MKVIEYNPIFAPAHVLLVASGAPVVSMIYCSVTGEPGPAPTTDKMDLRQ